MFSDSIERIEELGARGARKILIRGPREHHVVNEQSVFAGLKEIDERDRLRCAMRTFALENVVLGDDTAWREHPTGRRD
jgi:hypothetical protein